MEEIRKGAYLPGDIIAGPLHIVYDLLPELGHPGKRLTIPPNELGICHPCVLRESPGGDGT